MAPATTSPSPTVAGPRIGVSACLLGEAVRFDGGHKRHDFVERGLGRFVEFVPVCPEVESGMPVPRESVRLVEGADGVRMIGGRSGTDQTGRMTAWASDRTEALAEMDLDGFVLKKDSPSCGAARVRVYRDGGDGPPSRTGTGLFAVALRERLPGLPLTEEGWLNDHRLRETFLDSVFTHHRLRTSVLAAPSRAALVEFHARHKLLYMAHSPARYRELGRLVGRIAEQPLQAGLEAYASQSMAALSVRATPGKHANVLQHVVGYFKDVLTAFEKQEILSLVEEFRTGVHVLAVPLTLLVHHLHKHELSEWLASQVYFEPYPKALAAR